MRQFVFFISIFASFMTLGQETKKWSLEACIRHALEKNISIKQAQLEIETDEISKKEAFGSFLPTINAGGNHLWQIGLSQNPLTGILQNRTTQFTTFNASANIDLYKGLQNQYRLNRTRLQQVSTLYRIDKIKEDVALNVANAYLQILFNKENIKIAKNQLNNTIKQGKRSEELYNAGQIPRGDLIDVEANIAADEQRLVQAQNALLISKLTLGQLLQLEKPDDFDIIEEDYSFELSPILLKKPYDIINEIRDNRIEYKIGKANIEVAKKDISIAKSAFQPTLRAFYGLDTRIAYEFFNPLVGDFVNAPPFFNQVNDNLGQSFGLSINIPILNGFTVRNNVERAKVGLKRQELDFEQQKLTLERNIYTAHTDANGALKAYQSALKAVEARRLSIDYAKERFNIGAINSFDLNQAQLLLNNAEAEVLRTKYDYLFRIKILELYFNNPYIKR
jgi:outer membrane protein